MTKRASESLVAILIRIGLLIALAVMLIAENAQAQKGLVPCPAPSALPAQASPALATAGPTA